MEKSYFPDYHCDVVYLFDKTIEIMNGWGPGEYDIKELIENADIYEGIRFVKLENVLEWKKEMMRSKDIKHISLIESYLNK